MPQSDWSSDGTRIVYRSRRSNQFEVSIIDFRVRDATTGRPRITDVPRAAGGTQSSQPAWYPDMRRLLYRRTNAPVTTRSDIWTMNLDGSDRRPLVVAPEDQWYPSFSPDMSKVLFATTQPQHPGHARRERGDHDAVRPLRGELRLGADLVAGRAAGRVRARPRRRHGQLTTYPGRDESPDWGSAPTPAAVGGTVTSSAGNATLSVADTSGVAPGRLVNGTLALPQPLRVNGVTLPAELLRYGGPVANDPVTIAFMQAIGATDALRTGTYAKTLTFTLEPPIPSPIRPSVIVSRL